MQFSILFAATLLLVGAQAAPRSLQLRQDDPHVGDFRTYGVSGCSAENEGVYTELQSDVGVCKPFVEPAGSLSVTDLNDGCTLYVYADTNCSVERVALGAGTCYNDEIAEPNSYMIGCTTSAAGQ